MIYKPYGRGLLIIKICLAGISDLVFLWDKNVKSFVYKYIQMLNLLYINNVVCQLWASLMAQTRKNPPGMWETWVWSLGWEDLLEEGIASHSSILVCRIPMDRGAWWVTVHGVVKSRTRLSYTSTKNYITVQFVFM